jgi:ribosomal-protein-alanine N-acetyltransferase
MSQPAPWAAGALVRSLVPGDLAALTELDRDAFGDPWSPTALAALLARAGGGLAFGVEISADLCAYALWQTVVDEAELLRVGVAPPWRRRGLGRSLLVDCHRDLARRGVTRCHLDVAASNLPAIALYGALGYRQVGLRRAYYRDGSDALLMTRLLA